MTVIAAQPAVKSTVRANWRVYAIDGALLGLFMISACVSVAIIEHPSSPVRRLVESPLLRRAMIGLCMALTAIALIYSPWGKRSGAFMNPAMIVSFLRLGRIKPLDAFGYIMAQLVGGALGVLTAAALVGPVLSHPAVNYVATIPGGFGLLVAWLAEFVIAMVMISTVLAVNKYPRLAPLTGCFAAALVLLYITFEAPFSGMSLNPARTFGSSVVANLWTGWWIYLTAPILGMLAGIELHRLFGREHQRLCGKLSHSRRTSCFIRCNCLDEPGRTHGQQQSL
jgi:aquaporin Z